MRTIAFIGCPLARVRGAFALVGRALPLIGGALAIIRRAVAIIGRALARVGGPVTPLSRSVGCIGGPVALIGCTLARVGGPATLRRGRPAFFAPHLRLLRRARGRVCDVAPAIGRSPACVGVIAARACGAITPLGGFPAFIGRALTSMGLALVRVVGLCAPLRGWVAHQPRRRLRRAVPVREVLRRHLLRMMRAPVRWTDALWCLRPSGPRKDLHGHRRRA